MAAHAYSPDGTEEDRRNWLSPLAVSIACHLVLFLVLIFTPAPNPDRKFSPNVINVDLVKLPEKGKTTGPDKKTAKASKKPVAKQAKKPPVPPAKKAVKKISLKEHTKAEPKPAKAVSLSPKKKKTKTSLKKKTYKPANAVKRAITRIEKEVADSKPDTLKQALNRLKQKVEKTEAGARRQGAARKGIAGSPKGVSGESWAAAKRTADIRDIYRIEIAYQVQKNWAFSEQLAGGGRSLQASLVFKVMPNGEIRDIFFTDRSGNAYLDDSAYKAVMKSNPVDPHPSGVSEPFIQVGLRFTPEGVR